MLTVEGKSPVNDTGLCSCQGLCTMKKTVAVLLIELMYYHQMRVQTVQCSECMVDRGGQYHSH